MLCSSLSILLGEVLKRNCADVESTCLLPELHYLDKEKHLQSVQFSRKGDVVLAVMLLL